MVKNEFNEQETSSSKIRCFRKENDLSTLQPRQYGIFCKSQSHILTLSAKEIAYHIAQRVLRDLKSVD